jgi:hypothetical protein
MPAQARRPGTPAELRHLDLFFATLIQRAFDTALSSIVHNPLLLTLST